MSDSTNTSLYKNTRGFTLVELNMSIAILGIIMVSLLAVFTTFLVIIVRNNVSTDMTVDSQSLLRTVVEEIRYGAGVRQTNTITDANGPTGGWNTSNASFVIITAIPALNSSNEYIIDSDSGLPYFNEMVYFKQGTTLYKRVLANPGATGNKLKTTCPSAAASSSCPADIRLVDNVSSMIFTLYDQDNGSTTDPLLARSVKIDLTMTRETFGAPLTLDNSIRTTLRNYFK